MLYSNKYFEAYNLFRKLCPRKIHIFAKLGLAPQNFAKQILAKILPSKFGFVSTHARFVSFVSFCVMCFEALPPAPFRTIFFERGCPLAHILS